MHKIQECVWAYMDMVGKAVHENCKIFSSYLIDCVPSQYIMYINVHWLHDCMEATKTNF